MSVLNQFDKLLISQINASRLMCSIRRVLIDAFVLLNLLGWVSLILIFITILLCFIILHLVILIA